MEKDKNILLIKHLLKEVLEFYVYWNLNANEKELKIYEDFFMEDENILFKIFEKDKKFIYLLIHAINTYKTLFLLLPYAKLIKDNINYKRINANMFSQKVNGKINTNYIINQINKGIQIENIEKLKWKVKHKYYAIPENIFTIYILKSLANELNQFLKELLKESIKLDVAVTNSGFYQKMIVILKKTIELISDNSFKEILNYINQFQNGKSFFEESERYVITNINRLRYPYRKFYKLYNKYRELKKDYDFILEDRDNLDNRLFELFILKNIISFFGLDGFVRKNFRTESPIYIKKLNSYSFELYYQSSKCFNKGIYIKKNNIQDKQHVVKMIPDIVIKINNNDNKKYFFVIIDAKYKGEYHPEDIYQGISYLVHYQIRYNPFVLVYCKEKGTSLKDIEIIENRINPTEKLIRSTISINDSKYNKQLLKKISAIIVSNIQNNQKGCDKKWQKPIKT